MVDGVEREYVIAVGSKAGPGSPLLLIFHGFGAYGASLVDLIEERQWPEAIRVAPRGLPRTFERTGDLPQLGWQIRAGELEDRDLGFFDALVAELSKSSCVDPSRVYAMGFSNGGLFTNLLACRRSRALVAGAPIAGAGPFEACEAPVPMLVHHGVEDEVLEFEAGAGTFLRWQATNSCDEVAPPQQGCVQAEDCDAPTVMCAEPGGHHYPRGAAERIVRFFEQAGARATGR